MKRKNEQQRGTPQSSTMAFRSIPRNGWPSRRLDLNSPADPRATAILGAASDEAESLVGNNATEFDVDRIVGDHTVFIRADMVKET